MRENKSAYWGGTLRLCIIIALAAMVVVVGSSLLRLVDAKGSGGNLYYSLGVDIAVALLFYLVSCGALIAHGLRGGDDGASPLRRFLLSYARLLVFVPLSLIVGLVAGDLLQTAMLKIAGEPTGQMMTEAVAGNFVICFAFLGLFTGGVSVATTVVALWLVHSVGLVCGTYFRRFAWVKSVLFVAGLATVIVVLTYFVGKLVLDMVYGHNMYNIIIIDSPVATVATCAIMLVGVALCYRLAFRLYSRRITNLTPHQQ